MYLNSSLYIDTFGTGKLDDELLKLLNSYFDFTPANIKKNLSLIKLSLQVYLHLVMGRTDLNVKWEQVQDKALELKDAYEKTKIAP